MAFCSIREERGSEGPADGATLVKSLVSCCIDEAGVRGDTVARAARSLAGWTRAGQCATSSHHEEATVPSGFFSCGDAGGMVRRREARRKGV